MNLNTGTLASRMHLSVHRLGVAECHCSLSMARRAVFIVVDDVVVFSEVDGSSGYSTMLDGVCAHDHREEIL